MKTLLLIFTLLFSATAYAQTSDTLYCIQILSTKTPEYVTAEQLSIMPFDTVVYEQAGDYYRLMIVYSDLFEAEISLASWQRAYSDAFICRRTFAQASLLKKFYTNEAN
jgi:hypothetical protein